MNSDLTIEDIQMALNLIDYAAKAGAFREWQPMQAAVHVNARLTSAIEAHARNTPTTPAPAPEGEEAK